MSRGAAYSFSLAVIIPALLAIAHIQTGKPLVLRTVHDTVYYAHTKLVHDTVLRYRVTSPDTVINFDCRGDGGGWGGVSDPQPLDWEIFRDPDGSSRLIVFRRDQPEEVVAATEGGRHCLITRGPIKF